MEKELITAEQFKKRLVTLCLRGGGAGLPRRPRDRQILLKSIVLLMDPEHAYAPAALDELLKSWLAQIGRCCETDHATLRRLLVDEGYLERPPDGRFYRVCTPGPAATDFESAVNGVDVVATVQEARGAAAQRRRKHAARSGIQRLT